MRVKLKFCRFDINLHSIYWTFYNKYAHLCIIYEFYTIHIISYFKVRYFIFRTHKHTNIFPLNRESTVERPMEDQGEINFPCLPKINYNAGQEPELTRLPYTLSCWYFSHISCHSKSFLCFIFLNVPIPEWELHLNALKKLPIQHGQKWIQHLFPKSSFPPYILF